MRDSQRRLMVAVVATAIFILALPARGEEFYETRLREGEEALAAKRNLVAVERLRIAVFGLLDKPVLLSEGLAMLSLAQGATGKEAALDATLARFLELEKGFAVWDKAAVKPELRKEFVALLLKKVPPGNLKGIPSLSGLVEPAPSTRGKAPESKTEAKAVLVPAIQKDPENREARKALLEAAYLSKDWKLGAAQVEYLRPFAPGEEPQMFYSAVALFETGSLDEARILIRNAQPHLKSSPVVDYYRKKVLDQSP